MLTESRRKRACVRCYFRNTLPQNLPAQTQACACICSQPFLWYCTDLVHLSSACCDTLKSVNESLNRSYVSSTVLCCPSQRRTSVLFYCFHFSVTAVQVFAAMCTGWCWQQHCGRMGSPGPARPALGAVQTSMQSWFSPHSANEDDLYKIRINAEKHGGFDFTSFILPLDRLVYKAFVDWRCTALFCALQ